MFEELARLWLSDLAPRFKIHVSPAWHEDPALEGHRIVVPTEAQFANVNTMNSFELGFLYYAGTTDVPRGTTLPVIQGDEVSVLPYLLDDYVVITPEATVKSREFPPERLQKLREGLQARGLTVINLGKASGFTLTQAACILARSRGVFGLDNGLLHLAQCSKVPVFSLHTTIDPRLRVSPRQPGARTFYFSVDPKKLPCLFCNSKMRYVDIDFTKCHRGHYECANGFNPEIMLKKFDEVRGV